MPLIKKTILKQIYTKRDPWSRKYDYGHMLVIGGSKNYSGSPTFNAFAAIKAGVDQVTIISPERAANTIGTFAPDLITYPLRGDYLAMRHLDDLMKFTQKKDSVVIGGGLTREKETSTIIVEYLDRVKVPTVVDADAIHAIVNQKQVIENKDFIITPHTHEFNILSGKKLSTNLHERIIATKELAMSLGVVIVLKGHIDVISDGNEVFTNESGSPYMTKGGMGESLAGICGALLARKVNPILTASAATFINGLAGQIAAKKFGESVTTSDLIDSISQAIKS